VELDALHFERDWVEVPDERMRDLAREATTGDAWVVDGNYAAVRDVVWPRATQIVWLDLPFHVVFARLLVRTLRRGLTGAELWHGNRERLAVSFFSSQSVVWWMLRTFRQRRAAFVRLSAGFPIVRLRTAREVEAWVVATTAR
jgi:adenylate kinase family enzyme